MEIKKNMTPYIALFLFAVLIALSFIFEWIGFVSLIIGLCCIFYSIGIKARNAVLEDINNRLIDQIASINQNFGEAQTKIDFLTKALARYMVNTENNAEKNEKESDNTEAE